MSMKHRNTAGLVGAITVIAVLSGCAALGLGKPPGFDAEGVAINQVTCADFVQYEDQYRESGDEDIIDPITTYTADGADTWDSAADYFAAACEEVPADTTLYDLGGGSHDIECGDFRKLGPDVQAEWVSAWFEQYDLDFGARSVPSVVALFEQECAERGDGDLFWNASFGVEDQLTLLLSHEWVDRDGYRYRFELAAAEIDATSEVANALPGQATVTVMWEVTTRVTNLTSGRNAPYPVVSLTPLWESGSAACSGIENWASRPGFASNTPGVSAAWCRIFSDPISLATNIELAQAIPQGETVEATFQSDRLHANSTFSVPEADLSSALAALKAPAMWAIGLESSDQRYDCLLASGVWLVAATGDSGCQLAPEQD